MPLMLQSAGPTAKELEHLRLALSAFQDGSGWESIKIPESRGGGRTYYAGYRQFERVVADVFGGIAPENKGVFDVFVPLSHPDQYYGVSCKMRGALSEALKPQGRVYVEMSNAAGEFMGKVSQKVGKNFKKRPSEVGKTLLSLIVAWHDKASVKSGYNINLAQSSYLVLLYNRQLTFALYQYSLRLPKAADLAWSFPRSKRKGGASRRLVGRNNDRVVFEWYLHSGGQLKYYPLAQDAVWHSEPFQLEPLPQNRNVSSKAQECFPVKWARLHSR